MLVSRYGIKPFTTGTNVHRHQGICQRATRRAAENGRRAAAAAKGAVSERSRDQEGRPPDPVFSCQQLRPTAVQPRRADAARRAVLAPQAPMWPRQPASPAVRAPCCASADTAGQTSQSSKRFPNGNMPMLGERAVHVCVARPHICARVAAAGGRRGSKMGRGGGAKTGCYDGARVGLGGRTLRGGWRGKRPAERPPYGRRKRAWD
jgi:hypothetical protein